MSSHEATGLVVMGVLVQMVWMLYPWKEVNAVTVLGYLCLAALAICLHAARRNRNITDTDVLIAAGLFVALVAMEYREKLMPWIHEGAIVIWAPVFIYAVAISWGLRDPISLVLVSVAIGVVAAVLLIGELTPFVRLALYTAYLLEIVTVALMQFQFGDFAAISNGVTSRDDPVRFLLDGMGMTYLAVYGWYLFRVIPIPGRSQTIDERMKEWREETATMQQHFSAVRLNPARALGLIGFVSVALVTNYSGRWLAPWPMIALVLTTMPLLMNWAPVLRVKAQQPHRAPREQ